MVIEQGYCTNKHNTNGKKYGIARGERRRIVGTRSI